MYINEIIRITYKCNWKCKFCNVLKTNNFGEKDISKKEIIYKILELSRKYSKKELKNLILSFSGGEPTLNKNLANYIKLSKNIGVGNIQIQTNGSIIFYNFKLLELLINSGLNEIFLAQHSNDNSLNQIMGSFTDLNKFILFLDYYYKNKLVNKVRILTNIVINKINLYTTKDYISFLLKSNYFNIVSNSHISFGFVQPNGYANINKKEVLLIYNESELLIIKELINFCEKRNLSLDFHFTSPPLCIITNPEYNLEYKVLHNLENDKNNGKLINENLEKYKILWKEKKKFNECKKCIYNNYCLGFYKNWINFVGEKYVKEKINNFLVN